MLSSSRDFLALFYSILIEYWHSEHKMNISCFWNDYFIGFMQKLDEMSKADILKFILLMEKVKLREEI